MGTIQVIVAGTPGQGNKGGFKSRVAKPHQPSSKLEPRGPEVAGARV